MFFSGRLIRDIRLLGAENIINTCKTKTYRNIKTSSETRILVTVHGGRMEVVARASSPCFKGIAKTCPGALGEWVEDFSFSRSGAARGGADNPKVVHGSYDARSPGRATPCEKYRIEAVRFLKTIKSPLGLLYSPE
jgi:hypothetical protein